MKIEGVIKFTVRVANQVDCDRFNQPYGTLEVLNAEGFRVTWARNIDEAKQHLASCYEVDEWRALQ